MRLIAHRGFAANFPENTLRAIEEAVALADAIEVDVRRCGSGELVVIHDETVDRVTDGSGRVADLSLAELRGLDVLGTGAGVPTLADVIARVPSAVGLNVELKEDGTAADALAVLAGTDAQATVSSFRTSVLETARQAGPAVPRAYLFDEEPCASLERAVDLGCAFVHPHHDLCEQSFVDRAHREGMSVNAWTIDSRTRAGELADVGVDGVIADRWGVLPERSNAV